MATDYAQLANRISSFTTKCLLTGIVLVAGLGFGREVLRWWAADQSPAGQLVQTGDGLGDPFRPHLLQFGDLPWSLCRQTVVGPKAAAAAALRESCLRAVRNGTLPAGGPGKAENELLAELAAREPIDRQPGQWALYELDDAFPMVVATRPCSPLKKNDSRETCATASQKQCFSPGDTGDTASAKQWHTLYQGADNPTRECKAPVGHRGGNDRRVVTWGLAFPAGADAWTLCTFQSTRPSAGQSIDFSDYVIPPDCTRTLSVRVVGGGAVVAFHGPPQPETWKNFFQNRFTGNNWKMVGDWRSTGSAWHARYEQGDPGSGTSLEVRFGPDAEGRFSGLLVVTPAGGPGEDRQ